MGESEVEGLRRECAALKTVADEARARAQWVERLLEERSEGFARTAAYCEQRVQADREFTLALLDRVVKHKSILAEVFDSLGVAPQDVLAVVKAYLERAGEEEEEEEEEDEEEEEGETPKADEQ